MFYLINEDIARREAVLYDKDNHRIKRVPLDEKVSYKVYNSIEFMFLFNTNSDNIYYCTDNVCLITDISSYYIYNRGYFFKLSPFKEYRYISEYSFDTLSDWEKFLESIRRLDLYYEDKDNFYMIFSCGKLSLNSDGSIIYKHRLIGTADKITLSGFKKMVLMS